MSSGPLHSDVKLGIKLSAICARNQYTTNPEPVIDELIAAAGARGDILAKEAGIWSGFHEDDEHVAVLARALWEIPGVGPWIKVGRDRRAAPKHGAN